MSLKGKKTFATLDYENCDPNQCDPENGTCVAIKACSHKVIIQIDGAFEQPMINHELCQGCWECIEACPLGAIYIREIGI